MLDLAVPKTKSSKITWEKKKKKGKGDPPPAPARVWETSSKSLTAGDLRSKVSELDEVLSKFTQVDVVQNQGAFILKPLILKSGLYAGRKILMVVKGVTFLSLPAEIRNRILLEVLERDKAYEIDLEGQRYFGPSTTSALARVSREFHAEVIPIAYGSNKFQFSTLEQLRIFAHHIGGARAYLRRIEILDDAGLITSPRSSVFDTLPMMTKLQSLTFNHESIYLHALPTHGRMRIEAFVCQLKPFLHAWHQANKDEAGSRSILDLIRLVKHYSCSECGTELQDDAVRCQVDWCSEGRLVKVQKTGPKHLRKVSEKLRDMIAAELGLSQ